MSIFVLTQRKKRLVLVTLGVFCVVAFFLSLGTGPSGVSFGWLFNNEERELIAQLRIRRVVLALLTGAALASAGTALQALLCNPLADPFIIGVSGGAAVGGGIAICLGTGVSLFLLPASAFAGAMLSTLLLSWFLYRDGPQSTEATLLAGVVLNTFAAALVTLMKTALPADRAQGLLFWLVGTIGYPDERTLWLIGVSIALGIATLLMLSGDLEVMALGEREALRFGIDTKRLKWLTYGATALLVGVVIPFTGLIGFVGLAVPHLVKILIGSDLRLALPASALVGAGGLMIFDAVTRLSFLLVQTEIPVGAVTALFGAPVFAWVLVRHLSTGVRP